MSEWMNEFWNRNKTSTDFFCYNATKYHVCCIFNERYVEYSSIFYIIWKKNYSAYVSNVEDSS